MLSKSDAFYAKEDERLALVPGDGIIKIHALPGRGSSKVKRGGRGKFDFALFKLIGVKHFKSGARYFINLSLSFKVNLFILLLYLRRVWLN